MMSLVTLFQSVEENLDIRAIATRIITLAKYVCVVVEEREGREERQREREGRNSLKYSIYEQHCLPKLAILLAANALLYLHIKWYFSIFLIEFFIWHVWVLLWMWLLFFLSACIQVMLAME